MLPFLDDYIHEKHLRYWLISSSHIDNQRIPHSNSTRGTPGYMQQILPSTDNYGHAKSKISTVWRDIVHQKILQSDWK